MRLIAGTYDFKWLDPVVISSTPRWIALLLLCSAYIQGGYEKLFHFSDALAELQHFGVPPSAFLVWCSILVELGGPLLILTGILRWLGALVLAGFTCYASWLANRFWDAPPQDALRLSEAFYEHLGLVGGFLIVALADLRGKVSAR